jgi:phosphoglucomutase
MLKRLGFNFDIVNEQEKFDPRFSTVKSPNPENAEALTMGIELARKKNADLVIATDPDCDRLGVAVRSVTGEMKLLSGNQIGSLLVHYRIKKFFELGVLNKENASRAVTIKTFVTTDLQKVIPQHYGVRCVETLTGFKYFGAKLEKYEQALPVDLRRKYRRLSEEESRAARLAYSSFYVFGSEESYGYSGADFVRDKDGNAGAIMFCEVAAYAKSKDRTPARVIRGKAAHPNPRLECDAYYQFRDRHNSRRGRRRNSQTEDVDLRVGRRDADRGAGFRNRTEDQVLHLWSGAAKKRKI